MAVVPIEQLLHGIKAVETSGRKDAYTTVNSIGAHGAYQVMRANIAPWTKEAFGRAFTPAEFLASPRAQDDLARFRLARDMKKHNSWESAAAIWFSGQPNPDSKASDGGNTVRQYVDKVKDAMASWRGGSTPAPGGGTVTPIGLVDDTMSSLTGAVGGISSALGGIAQSVGAVGTLATWGMKLALPSTWVRIGSGVFGVAFLLLGLLVLGREARGTSA